MHQGKQDEVPHPSTISRYSTTTMMRAIASSADCDTSSTVRLESRSAATPPNGDMKNMGMPCASATTPSQNAEPVNS